MWVISQWPLLGGIAGTTLQVTSCNETSGNGFLPQIHGKIIILLANLDIQGARHGSPKGKYSQNGSHLVQVPYYGFTENVSIPLSCFQRD